MSLAVTLALALLSPGLYGPAENPSFGIERKLMELGKLPIAVTYPKGATGPHPVIIWSHGMYGSRNSYRPLVDILAGNGYVVIQPTHRDSVDFMTPEQRRALLTKPNTNATFTWDERPGEVSACIDALPSLEKPLSLALDRDRVAVGGHSFGAWTTQALAGMEMAIGNRSRSFHEPRLKAFVVLSGSGPGGAVSAEGLKKMQGPMLMITGTNDTARSGDTGEWRRKGFELAAPGNKWLVWIEGATHTFGGIAGRNTQGARQFIQRAGLTADANKQHTAIVVSAIVSFFDTHVKGLKDAKTYWTSRTLEKAGGVTVTSK